MFNVSPTFMAKKTAIISCVAEHQSIDMAMVSIDMIWQNIQSRLTKQTKQGLPNIFHQLKVRTDMTSEFSTDDVLSSPVFSSHSAQPI
jgi:hypothetical protein